MYLPMGYDTEVYLRDASRGDELWESIMAAGKAYGVTPASPSCQTPGTRLTVETPDGGVAARVVQKPFIDPNKTLPRQG